MFGGKGLRNTFAATVNWMWLSVNCGLSLCFRRGARWLGDSLKFAGDSYRLFIYLNIVSVEWPVAMATDEPSAGFVLGALTTQAACEA